MFPALLLASDTAFACKSIAQIAFIRKDQIYFSDIGTIEDVYSLVRNSRRTRRACHMVQEDG